MNDVRCVNPDAGFAPIIHHDMKMRRCMASRIHANQTICKTLNDRHDTDHSATIALFAVAMSDKTEAGLSGSGRWTLRRVGGLGDEIQTNIEALRV